MERSIIVAKSRAKVVEITFPLQHNGSNFVQEVQQE